MKSLALSAYVSPQKIHFQALDKSPVPGPEKGPPFCNIPTPILLGFPCGSAGKESSCNAGDLGSTPRLGRSPGEGKGYPLQYSGLENSMDCIVHGGHKESDMTDGLSLSFSTLSWLCALRKALKHRQETPSATYNFNLNLCLRAKSLQWGPTFCDSMGPPGSSVHGVSQARTLEWVTISSSRGSSQLEGRFFITTVTLNIATSDERIFSGNYERNQVSG